MRALKRLIAIFLFGPFMVATVPFALAVEVAPWMPPVGTVVTLSAKYEPALMLGIQIDARDPFKFNFLIERGQSLLSDEVKRDEYKKLVKHFLASLTIPNNEMWVNLSPYEHDRIIPDSFGLTETGRDLLAQDYMLKQITSSLIHPEEGPAKDFWQKVYQKAFDKYGTTDIPLDTFNKVWIVPDTATIFHRYDTALIVENHLKVMMEQDYLALEKNRGGTSPVYVQERGSGEAAQLAAEVVREIVIPFLEKEVNEGENFARLRQVYSAMLMATWFKKSLKESVLGQVYADKARVAGLELNDSKEKEEIYQKYLQAYKVGVFNLVKEDTDPFTQEVIPRKYFSGGTLPYLSDPHVVTDLAGLTDPQIDHATRVAVDKVTVSLGVARQISELTQESARYDQDGLSIEQLDSLLNPLVASDIAKFEGQLPHMDFDEAYEFITNVATQKDAEIIINEPVTLDMLKRLSEIAGYEVQLFRLRGTDKWVLKKGDEKSMGRLSGGEHVYDVSIHTHMGDVDTVPSVVDVLTHFRSVGTADWILGKEGALYYNADHLVMHDQDGDLSFDYLNSGKVGDFVHRDGIQKDERGFKTLETKLSMRRAYSELNVEVSAIIPWDRIDMNDFSRKSKSHAKALRSLNVKEQNFAIREVLRFSTLEVIVQFLGDFNRVASLETQEEILSYMKERFDLTQETHQNVARAFLRSQFLDIRIAVLELLSGVGIVGDTERTRLIDEFLNEYDTTISPVEKIRAAMSIIQIMGKERSKAIIERIIAGIPFEWFHQAYKDPALDSGGLISRFYLSYMDVEYISRLSRYNAERVTLMRKVQIDMEYANLISERRERYLRAVNEIDPELLVEDRNQKAVNEYSRNGGIDFDAGQLNMTIKRDGEGLPLPLAMQDPAMNNITGLAPTILEIAPASALPIFIELRSGRAA
ncbi:MAG: hypothetical protein HQL20_11055 [Candidatus Omnitrophica bacterium]|nr:hypothetical protein [Candidatus Omnitrophota bacterium]